MGSSVRGGPEQLGNTALFLLVFPPVPLALLLPLPLLLLLLLLLLLPRRLLQIRSREPTLG